MFDTPSRTCPACGIDLGYMWPDRCPCGLELPQYRRIKHGSDDDPEVFEAAELDAPDWEMIPVESAASETLAGGFVRGETWLVHGPGGSGKSRLLLRWASRAPALVVSLEMAPEVCVHSARTSRADLRHLRIVTTPDWRRHVGRRRVVVFDSLTETDDPISALGELREWAQSESGLVLAICQETTEGEPRGGPRLVHNCDARARITRFAERQAQVEVLKRRMAAPGTSCVVSL